MKKTLFIKVLVVSVFCAIFSFGVNAQDTFKKGDNVASVGIGLGSTLWGSGLPIFAQFEHGIKDHLFDDKSSIGIGGYLGYESSKYFGSNWTYIIVGVKGDLHYELAPKLDGYAGLMIGYNIVSIPSDWYGASYGGLIVPFHIGARYFFSDKIGAFAELGYGIAYLQLGLSLKF